MAPFIFLGLFGLLAIGSLLTFGYLSWRDKTWRDDWKKFLPSFAGTALGLAVGFMSLVVQQHNQNQQRQSEESARIRAGLLYSVAQKKLIRDMIDDSKEPGNPDICDVTKNVAERDQAFKNTLLGHTSADTLDEYRENYTSVFNAKFFQDGVLNELFKTTGLASRIDQTLATALLEREAGLLLLTPRRLLAYFDPSLRDREKYCTNGSKIYQDIRESSYEGAFLQIYTCTAYAILGPDVVDSVGMSEKLVDHIKKFNGSDGLTGRDARLNDLRNIMGSAMADFVTCLKSADIDLGVL